MQRTYNNSYNKNNATSPNQGGFQHGGYNNNRGGGYNNRGGGYQRGGYSNRYSNEGNEGRYNRKHEASESSQAEEVIPCKLKLKYSI